MYNVVKRDGRSVEFNITRICNAITKAFDATGIPYSPDVINLLALQVTADFAPKVSNDQIEVEAIQDSVEAVLQRTGYAEVAKAYILYRKNREKLRHMSSTILDYKGLVDGYLDVADWDVSSAENMSNLFCGCIKLKKLDVENWNVSNVKDVTAMFSNCEVLEQPDVTKWDVSNVTAYDRFFDGNALINGNFWKYFFES